MCNLPGVQSVPPENACLFHLSAVIVWNSGYPELWVPHPWRCPRPWMGSGQSELGGSQPMAGVEAQRSNSQPMVGVGTQRSNTQPMVGVGTQRSNSQPMVGVGAQ